MIIVRTFILGAVLIACACALQPKKPSAKIIADEILAPYMPAMSRAPAAQAGEVVVHMPNHTQFRLSDALVFPATGDLNSADVARLTGYIDSHREQLGASGPIRFALVLVNQAIVGDSRYVRFQQVIQRSVVGAYKVPVDGASIIAIIKGGSLVALNNQLMTPPPVTMILAAHGLRFDFSATEFAHFMELIKTTDAAADGFRTYMNQVTAHSGQPFNVDRFYNREMREQMQMLNAYFANFGRMEISRLLIDLARGEHLSIVRYGTKWMLQVNEVFGLPMAFDLEIPLSIQQPVIARNLRDLAHKIATVRGFQSPAFPGGAKVEGGVNAQHAVQRMQQALNYYADNFGWTSFGGKDSQNEVDIHTQLRSLDFHENAAWLQGLQKFVVGEGGRNLYHLDDSVSVLGHEFAHAIVQHSSGLVYRNESGALNEHFADIEGASIEAEVEHNGEFQYTVGRDVLTPQVTEEKEKLLSLILTKYGYKPEEVIDFDLNRVGLRHLYAPALSFATQYDHVQAARAVYSANCQPSYDNDNCGVHTVSGVPNRAAALIIAELGLKETRQMFFNTIVYRLTSSSTFEDYLVQLYDECEATPALQNKCGVILASFAVVGVQHPAHKIPVAPVPHATDKTAIPEIQHAVTPTLKFCGWVKLGKSDSVQIFDDHYNATIVARDNEIKTKGNFQYVRRLQCACVTGRVTQLEDDAGKLFNALLNVDKFEDRGDECASDPRIADKRPANELQNDEHDNKPSTYCGWVSVKSASHNVTIIDNRYDVALLASGYPTLTGGDFSGVYKSHCACVRGQIGQVKNAKGTTFNYVKAIEAPGITVQENEACAGILWK